MGITRLLNFGAKSFRICTQNRFYSLMSEKRGIVLGVYTTESEEGQKNELNKLTSYAEKYDNSVSGEILKKIQLGNAIKRGECRLYWGIGSDHTAIAVAGLGKDTTSTCNILECLNEKAENVRIAAAVGAKSLLKEGICKITLEDFGDAQNAAIGATLGTYKYQEEKTTDKKTPCPEIGLVKDTKGADEWKKGVVIAESQNFARTLMEAPANLMTPTIFSEKACAELKKLGVECIAHDKKWAEDLKMNSFLSVSKGSEEPPVFLEVTYKGASENEPFVCLVGKGITFDSGGISIKPSANMGQMKADMGGAANVVGTIRALASLKAPVNVKGLMPLCENLPSGKANKPGDVVVAMNGKSICIDNTDAEGRLVLADALCYSEKFNPKFILDIATLTGAIIVALGDCVVGCYTNDEKIWDTLNKCGMQTGDRVWRMPLFNHYKKLVTEYDGFDLNNIGKGKGGGSCTAAAFLREFVPENVPWVHVDMAGVMGDCSDQIYTGSKGMTGRPMRTLVEFILQQET